MAWPSAPLLHPKELFAARSEVAAIANAISRFEPVTMFASHGTKKDLRRRLNANVSLSTLPVDDLWIRDSGPVFALSASKDIHGIDFNFNYWGGKFPQGVDVDLARRILALADIPRVQAQVRAEGGGLEVDGEGTLLATESCLINPNRNPGLSKYEIEDRLKTALGVEKVIWFKGVRDADTTDCHVDALARFVSPGRVVLSKPNPARPGVWTDVYE
jgi:agmatine deiminase